MFGDAENLLGAAAAAISASMVSNELVVGEGRFKKNRTERLGDKRAMNEKQGLPFTHNLVLKGDAVEN